MITKAAWLLLRKAGEKMAWASVHNSVKGEKLRKLTKELDSVGKEAVSEEFYTTEEEALGALVKLWIWGLENASPEGELISADKEDILEAFSLKFIKKYKFETIVDKLIKTKWMEVSSSQTYSIHDWDVWQNQWYKAKETRKKDAERQRKRRRKLSEQEGQMSMDENLDIPVDSQPDSQRDSDTGEAKEGCEGSTPQPEEQPKPEPAKYTADFEVFWDAYPRKADKGMAYKKYMARLNDGYSPAELLEAAKNYALQCRRQNTEKQYIKHPKTFLGDSTPFLDYLPRPAAPPPPSGSQGGSNPFAEYEGDE